ncbi:hypothetical protein PF005_g20041 [Phytophthora fragariae]|uniref:Secreted protein n=1 Tax=Phytophthora fragariae TaxID=53985 RepID=A0A6A3RRI1_9STRA|nr:hypothetical protein PF007_g14726 [Phytophthora fragariae]KAE9121081.1 hypothetical protein PF006_g17986 [Phytophthora fragariae]KAE9188477.1 hypothetical protein PF005_g20041 [Phytophthora fragariae]KAE9216517.1 hypothetical protein PF002_g17062 [Phytophthora fragariae]
MFLRPGLSAFSFCLFTASCSASHTNEQSIDVAGRTPKQRRLDWTRRSLRRVVGSDLNTGIAWVDQCTCSPCGRRRCRGVWRRVGWLRRGAGNRIQRHGLLVMSFTSSSSPPRVSHEAQWGGPRR